MPSETKTNAQVETNAAEPERKLPLWAILAAVGAFLAFIGIFGAYAISMQGGI
jgi:hypothetical protein